VLFVLEITDMLLDLFLKLSGTVWAEIFIETTV